MIPAFPALGSNLPSKSTLPPPPQSYLNVRGFQHKVLYRAVGLFSVGAAFLFLGVFFHYFILEDLHKELDDSMIINSKNHSGYMDWVNNQNQKIGLEYTRIYAFNVTNLERVIAGDPPILQEIGPYAYRVYRTRLDVEFGSNPYEFGQQSGDTVRFKEYRRYVFDSTRSGEGLNPLKDSITTVDLYYLSWANQTEAYNNNSRLFTTLSVDEMVWKYRRNHPLRGPLRLMLLNNYTSERDCIDRAKHQAQRTGQDDHNHIRERVVWDGSTFCLIEGKYCWKHPTRVEGTDMSQFKFHVSGDDRLNAWLPNVLRAVSLLHYSEDNPAVKGIETIRFRVRKETFMSQQEYPPNEKYYHTRPSGLMNVTLSYSRLPLWMSQPHFYDGDENLYKNWNVGLAPEKNKHHGFVDVEPRTGTTMESALRFQINTEIRFLGNQSVPTEYQGLAKNIYLPMIWVEDKYTVSDEGAEHVKKTVYFRQDLALGSLIAGCVSGSILVLSGGALVYLEKKKQKRIEMADASTEREPLVY